MADEHGFIRPSAKTRPRLIDKACFDEWAISAGMVVRQSRINDGADRLVRNLSDRREHLVGHLFVSGID